MPSRSRVSRRARWVRGGGSSVLVLTMALGSAGVGSSGVGRAQASERPVEGVVAASGGAAGPVGSIHWRGCGDGTSTQCATLRVPLDHAAPAGKMIDIALNRVPARRPNRRLGALVVNPGGPGASGLRFAPILGRILASRLTDRFDIVGFDPRGVGKSAPIRCLDGPALDRYFDVDPSPDTTAEIETLIEQSRLFAEGCLQRSGSLLAHISTVDVARDLDLIRQAVGDDKLTFLGFSYGSLIGATYAQLFPGRVRALVLDGMLDPAATLDERDRLQAIGFERNLQAFFADCVRKTACPFRSGGDPAGAFDRLSAQIDQTPLVVGRRRVGPGQFTTAVISQLYDTRRGWPRLASALRSAERGKGAALLQLFDAYADRAKNGTFANTNEANAAVNCADLPSSRDPLHYRDVAEAVAAEAPHFGAATTWYMATCAFWPVPVTPPPVGSADGAPPLLIIGTTQDPATPYVWAEQVAKTITGAVLLTYRHDGHTAYLRGPACIKDAVNRYLLDLRLPAVGTVCG